MGKESSSKLVLVDQIKGQVWSISVSNDMVGAEDSRNKAGSAEYMSEAVTIVQVRLHSVGPLGRVTQHRLLHMWARK